MKIKTSILQEMVGKVVKASSNNKLLPITSLMAISLEDGILSMRATDKSNYLLVSHKMDTNDESLYAVIGCDLFAKLVSKLTCDETILVVADGVLTIHGNGEYSLPLTLDDDGTPLNYPNPFSNAPKDEIGTITLATIKTILNSLKPSLAVTMECPFYTGYYFGDDYVLATDTEQVSALNIEKIFNCNVLISGLTLDLLNVSDNTMYTCYLSDNNLYFEDNGDVSGIKCALYGSVLDGIDSYNAETIADLLSQVSTASVDIDKFAILDTLDRIALFVGTFDDGLITLKFDGEDSSLTIRNSDGSSTEKIPYTTISNPLTFTCAIDVNMLRTQIKSQITDTIRVNYGNPSSITLVDTENNLQTMLGLLSE